MSPVKILAFLNRFDHRLEIVVDWVDEWPTSDPFAGRKFWLNVDGTRFELTPMIPSEVAEQLRHLALPSSTDSFDLIAPRFVQQTAGMFAGPIARNLLASNTGRTRTLRELYDPNVKTFVSPNILADFSSWMDQDTLNLRRNHQDVSADTPADEYNDLPDVSKPYRRLLGMTPQADVTDRAREDARNPNAFLDRVRSNKDSRDVDAFAKAVEDRATAELLLYAEGLRRERIYTRRRIRKGVNVSPRNADPGTKLQGTRADLRRVARDEPVIGAMFHVLRWFEWPTGLDAALKAAIAAGNDTITIVPEPNDGVIQFEGAPTHFVEDGDGFVTALRKIGDTWSGSYLPDDVVARQLGQALIEDSNEAEAPLHAPLHTAERNRLDRLERLFLRGGALPLSHDVPKGLVQLAQKLNNAIYKPTDERIPLNALPTGTSAAVLASPPAPTEQEEIGADDERALHDGAESVRHNLPPFDAIGITWDRVRLQRLIAGAQTDPTEHSGFKGFRIDARENDHGWISLCTLERECIDRNGTVIFRSNEGREGQVTQTVQNHSRDKDKPARLLTLPNDAVRWAGGSICVPSPIDGLSQALPRTNTDDHPVLALRERGTTTLIPRYGSTYAFRARGVGLSGIGPHADEPSAFDPASTVHFKRAIPMREPKCAVAYENTNVVNPADDGKKVKNSEADLPRLAASDGRMILKAQLPLAHWRVALHARGISETERLMNGGVDFENACARFVARSRDNWGRIGRATEQNPHQNGAYLSAVDPDCEGIQVVTKVWMPFSTCPHEDRHIVTGVTLIPARGVKQATFSQLVVDGERLVEDEHLKISETITIPVAGQSIPHSDLSAPAQLLAGFHSVVEASGIWSSDSICPCRSHWAPTAAVEAYERAAPAPCPHQFVDEPRDVRRGIGRFSRHVQMRQSLARAIGGKLNAMPDKPMVLGTQDAFMHGGWLRVEANYAGIAAPERERDLIAPNTPAAPSPGCDVQEATPTRTEIITWRKHHFDEACKNDPRVYVQQDCDSMRRRYQEFVKGQMGPVDFPEPVSSRELNVELKPQVVQPSDSSLVVPVFTFPGQAVYKNPLETDRKSTILTTFGDFGTFGVKSVTIVNGGTGYDADTTQVGFTDANGKDAKARVVVENGVIKAVVVEDPGSNYGNPAPAVTFTSPTGSGAAATAEVSRTGRRLPWIDDEITWTVRLAWRVALDGNSPVTLPLELSAVREFRLYRRDTTLPGRNKDEDRPLAVITRPGREVLERVNLDHVEFTWVDAITDRDLHHYQYTIEAIPEDAHTFRAAVWAQFTVIVPDSKIAPRPDSMRFIPMKAREESRRLGLYLSDERERLGADHVTYFVARAAQDPMLDVKTAIAAAGSRNPFTPTAADVFPATSRVDVATNFAHLRALRPKPSAGGTLEAYDGALAAINGSNEGDEVLRKRRSVFEIRSRIDGEDLVKAADPESFGNPFFRIHVHTFDDGRFPALAHTAASDPGESEWLQFYPTDLSWSDDPRVAGIKAKDAWGNGASGLLWYRYHFFAPATDTMSFHVATFYDTGSSLRLDNSRLQALSTSWRRFTGVPPSSDPVELSVVVEEGMLASTYSVDTATDEVQNQANGAIFQVLRSTPSARLLHVVLP